MAAISEIENKVNSCSGQDVATGKLGCNVEFGTPLHLIGLKSGTSIPAATVFNLDYINGLVQAGTAIPLVGADNFEPLSSEDAMFTWPSGIEQKNLDGLPKYKLSYSEGHQFYREMDKMEGYKQLDFLIGDNLGNWKMVKKSDGDYKGYSAGMVVAEMTKDAAQGGDPESKSLIVQFINRREWDQDYIILLRDNLTNDPEDFQGVNASTLAFDVTPAAAATEIVVSVILDADNNTPVEGLLVPDFLYTVEGVTEVPSGIAEVSGVYTLTVVTLVAAETITLQLYDSTAIKNIIITSSGATFKSNIITQLIA